MFSALRRCMGRRQAAIEFRWMQRAVIQDNYKESLQQMVNRRVAGEPLQYILGTQPFGPLNLLTRPPVLIPRPETEHWVIRLAESLSPTAQRPIQLLDLGTGSACIPLLLCHLWPPGSTKAHAVDISPHALRLASDNAALCAVPSGFDSKNPKNTLSLHNANFLSENFSDAAVVRFNSPFHLITSNPPYIPWGEFLRLPRSVTAYEDHRALFGGPTGLEFYNAIARLISHHNILASDGILALEVGHDQASTVQKLMRDTARFHEIDIWSDPWGKQRTVIARM